MAGRMTVASGSGAHAADAVLGWRLRRVPALVPGAHLACFLGLVLAMLLVATAPSGRPLALLGGSHSRTLIPSGLAPTASASIGASDRSFWPVRRGASLLTAEGGAIHSTFTASGVALRVAGGTLGLSLTAVGRGAHRNALSAVAPTAAANQVVYRYGSISESYRNGPYGLEQGFTVSRRPSAGTGPLVLVLRTGGTLTPTRVGSQVLFAARTGTTKLSYGQLSAVDATGRRLPARIRVRSGALQLLIDDSNAKYPLRIDPFIQQGTKLTGEGEVSGGGYGVSFGGSVALSADGNTALIGGPGDDLGAGAVWVFTRSGATWTQAGEKLTGGGESGKGFFGGSVALSADGNTALVGGAEDDKGAGAAWIFIRTGATWTQAGEKLTGGGESGAGEFGKSVALSLDGTTALIGGPADDSMLGAAWVFIRAGSSWAQQGEKLIGTGASGDRYFGGSLALSSDGDTALIGGPAVGGDWGAAWVFTRSGSTWTQQGEELAGLGRENSAGRFGEAVALSADGGTALIGSGYDDADSGSAWVFTRSGSTWTQQGEKLTGSGESFTGVFGASVALSADGNLALIGGVADDLTTGAAWIFARSGSTWTQQGEKLTGGGESGKGVFGASVALSADGNTALIGGPADGTSGAAWAFVNPPSAVTGSASAITQSTVTLGATVNPDGGATGECSLEYGTTLSYEASVPCTPEPGSGTDPVAVSASIVGLTVNTTYHFRVSAADTGGVGYGSDQTFQTLPNPPAVVTGAASSVGVNDAIMAATVNPNGGQVSVCRFEYGTTSAYGSAAPCSASGQTGENPVEVSAALVGLSASTGYHFRIVAGNAGGTGYGGDGTFKTSAPPPPRVESSMKWRFGVARRYTIVESLTALAVPTGGYVTVACSGRCPFSHHRSATVGSRVGCRGKRCPKHAATQGSTIGLAGLFKGRHLDVGTRISVSILKAGWVGKSFVFKVRAGKQPSEQIACLAPGSSNPRVGC
jgi:hypothetical protein